MFDLEKEIVLPSGVRAVITEMTGEHARFFGKLINRGDRDAYPKVLHKGIIKELGDKKGDAITLKDLAENMLDIDISYIACMVRILTYEHDPSLTIPYVWETKEKKRVQHTHKVNFTEDGLNIKYAKDVLDHPINKGKSSVLPIYDSYKDIQRHYYVELPRLGEKKIKLTKFDLGFSKKYKVVELDTIMKVALRQPMLVDGDKETVLNIDKTPLSVLERLKEEIDIHEGYIDTKVIIQSPFQKEEKVVLDALHQQGFFYQSGQIS